MNPEEDGKGIAVSVCARVEALPKGMTELDTSNLVWQIVVEELLRFQVESGHGFTVTIMPILVECHSMMVSYYLGRALPKPH